METLIRKEVKKKRKAERKASPTATVPEIEILRGIQPPDKIEKPKRTFKYFLLSHSTGVPSLILPHIFRLPKIFRFSAKISKLISVPFPLLSAGAKISFYKPTSFSGCLLITSKLKIPSRTSPLRILASTYSFSSTLFTSPKLKISSQLELLPKVPLVPSKEETLYLPVTEKATLEEEIEIGKSGGICDFLFDPIDRKRDSLRGAFKPQKRPVCLILLRNPKESYEHSIQYICREIYREVVGGLPEALVRSEEYEKEIETELKGEERVWLIKEEDGYFTCLRASRGTVSGEELWRIKWEKLRDQLQQLPHQKFGYIIFSVKNPEEFRFQLEKEIKPVKVEIYSLKFKDFALDLKKKLCKIAFGFIEPIKGGTFDEVFYECEDKFNKELEKMVTTIYARYTKRQKEKEESDDHYQMKVFVVRHLVKNEKVDIACIKTEEETPKGPVPDVWIGNRVIEVETLYGTQIPLKKIDETVDKYNNFGYSIQILLKPLTLLRYLKEIEKRRKLYRKEGTDVEFYTLNMEKKSLMSLEDLKNSLVYKEVSCLMGRD